MTDHTPIEQRLARIERVIAGLSAELAAIRAELRSNGATPEATPPPSPRALRDVFRAEADAGAVEVPSVPPSKRFSLGSRPITSHDLERLVGSYGMLAIAVLAAVAAVGTFLSWAIKSGFLVIGPAARVVIGLAAAAAVGVWGARLRRRERAFGSTLLGLALVIVHVCAYAAGPSFGLVPTSVAFVGAAVASWALTVFAHREGDEPLWCVGFGGAAVAPFVTSNGHGSLYALLAYATLVLLSGCFSINKREWPIAWRIFYLASALFVVAAAWEARNTGATRFVLALAFPLVIAVIGVAPLAVPSRKRGAIRWLSLLAALTGAYREAGIGHHAGVEVVALIAAMIVSLALVDRESEVEQSSMVTHGRAHPAFLDWLDAFGIPLIFAAEAGFSVGSIAPVRTVLATASAALVLFCVRRGLGGLRDASAFGAVALAVGAIGAGSVEAPAGLTASLVGIALAAFAMHVIRPSKSWLRSGSTTFFVAAMISIDALGSGGYHSAPFLREASVSAAIVLGGLIVVARSWRMLRAATHAAVADGKPNVRIPFERRALRATMLSPWLWAFVWVLIELARAYSPTASTLLLVTYFAATGVACVAAGRSRSSSRLRQVGLALAVVAAATAVYGAHEYFDFGARILADLVISAFLLGIAYWYRRPGAEPSPA
jgi:hypothetical protein